MGVGAGRVGDLRAPPGAQKPAAVTLAKRSGISSARRSCVEEVPPSTPIRHPTPSAARMSFGNRSEPGKLLPFPACGRRAAQTSGIPSGSTIQSSRADWTPSRAIHDRSNGYDQGLRNRSQCGSAPRAAIDVRLTLSDSYLSTLSYSYLRLH
jgi:hypothetical protein